MMMFGEDLQVTAAVRRLVKECLKVAHFDGEFFLKRSILFCSKYG
jgi:hypothetical protein